MKVTVIITNYNYEKYISEAINSVLNQEYRDFEVIVIDDGSTDGSKEIIEEYKRQYPKIIKVMYKENGGQSAAINMGWALAEGDIVALLDADDYWYPNKLKEIVFKHFQGYGLVQHALRINDGYELAKLSTELENLQKYVTCKHGFPGVIPTSGMSLLKKQCEFIFPLKESIRINSDLYIRWLAVNKVTMGTIEASLGCYRVHGSNNWFNNKSMDIAFEIGKIIEQTHQIVVPFHPYSYRDTCLELIGMQLLEQQKYIIYGTGDLGQKVSDIVKNRNSEVICYIDSFNNGYKLNSIDVESPNILIQPNYQQFKLIIASVYTPEILNALEKLEYPLENVIISKF